MASGNQLFTLWAQDAIPTGTVGAPHAIISDGSTPTLGTPVLAYDGGSADEHADWHVVLPDNYSGDTGFTFSIYYTMSGTATGDVQFEVRAKKVTVDTSDLNGADFGMDTQTATDLTDTPPGASGAGVVAKTPTGTMAKANAGTPSAGDMMVVRVSRDYNHAANTDDAHFICLVCAET